MGSTAPENGVRRQAANQGHVGTSIKTYAPPTDLKTKNIAMGTQVASNALSNEAGDEVMDSNLEALEQAGLGQREIDAISKARKMEKDAYNDIVAAFENTSPPPVKDHKASIKWLQGTPPNLDFVKSQLEEQSKNLQGSDLQTSKNLLKELKTHTNDPEALDDAGIISLKGKLMNSRTVLGRSDKELRAKVCHDFLMAGTQTTDAVISAGVIGEGLHETTQSQLIDDTLIKCMNGELDIKTTKSGRISIRDSNGNATLSANLRYKDGSLRYETNCRGSHLMNTAAR